MVWRKNRMMKTSLRPLSRAPPRWWRPAPNWPCFMSSVVVTIFNDCMGERGGDPKWNKCNYRGIYVIMQNAKISKKLTWTCLKAIHALNNLCHSRQELRFPSSLSLLGPEPTWHFFVKWEVEKVSIMTKGKWQMKGRDEKKVLYLPR